MFLREKLSDVILFFIDLVFGLAILALVLRFFLRLFGANPSTEFVNFIYMTSDPLLAPFRGVFAPLTVQPGNVLEFTTLFAILIYMIAAWLLIEFMQFIAYSASKSYRAI
jgi:uncharacterized protein YggT (Ycf19 family)